MSDWKEYRLGDIALSSDFVANGSFASLKENVKYLDSENYAILIRLYDFHNNWKGPFVYVDEGSFNFLKKSNVEPGDLIIANVGANAGESFLAPPLKKSMTLGPNSILIKGSNCKYLFYYFNSTYGKWQLDSIITGSAQPKFNKTDLRNLKVKLPSETKQGLIVEILSSLDDKIELNNKINQELETLAQALFNLICMVDETQDNDGWSTIKLKDVLSIKNGYAFKGMDFIESGIPVIKIKNVKSGKINFNNLSFVSDIIANKVEKFKIKKYDLLITMSGNRIDGSIDTWVGKVGMFPKNGEYLLNQRVSILKFENDKLKYFLLQLLSSEEYQYHFISNATSSGGQANISPDLIYNTEILLPPTDKIEIFDSVASDIYSIIFNNMSENESLIELRDNLLPKLISGELEINEINN